MTRVFLFLGMVAIPFSAFNGLPFLGELAAELSTYFFVPAVAVAAFRFLAYAASGPTVARRPSPSLLTAVMLASVCIILLSFIVNAGPITTFVLVGRTALTKFATSFVVILYCFALSYAVFFE